MTPDRLQRKGRAGADLYAASLCPLSLCALAVGLAGCGGGQDLDAGTVLARDARAELIGTPAPAATDDPVTRPRTVELDVPARVLGASSLDDFLFQSADVALKADAQAFGPCLERRVAGRDEDFVAVRDPQTAILMHNGAQAVWQGGIDIGGCAPARRHNVLIVTYADRPTAYLPLLPGSSAAGLTARREATRTVFRAVEDHSTEQCIGDGKIRVRTTRLADDDARPGRDAWQEIWTTHYCGIDYDVTVRFTPDQSGTTIDVPPARIAAVDLGWPLP